MRIFLAINDPNTGMLYSRFKDMSKNAKAVTKSLIGERRNANSSCVEALERLDVSRRAQGARRERAMRIHLTAHGSNAGFKDYLKEQGVLDEEGNMKLHIAGLRRIPELFPEVVEEMKIFMAGRNQKQMTCTEALLQHPQVKEALKYRPTMLAAIKKDEEAMRIYLSRAGTGLWKPVQEGAENGGPLSLAGCGKFYVLESFAYIKPNDIIVPLIPFFKGFLLDSGAFTFMAQTKGPVDFDEYLRRYIAFIKKYDIQHFFELDVDSIVGYEKVKEYRRILERETGRRCIPVWHRARGKEDFLRMCDEYDYVAIGGIVTKEIRPSEHKYFPWFIKEAHKRGAKIHGLGYTNINGLSKYHFDSVDSSSWTSGNRFGHLYKFTGRGLQQIKKPLGTRVKARITAINNFVEWVKFSEWAETHL